MRIDVSYDCSVDTWAVAILGNKFQTVIFSIEQYHCEMHPIFSISKVGGRQKW